MQGHVVHVHAVAETTITFKCVHVLYSNGRCNENTTDCTMSSVDHDN